MSCSAAAGSAVNVRAFSGLHPRAGLSLLEVLVAGGILVVGLASIAAMLPAAGSRLAQATQADRAGIMAANAYAEVMNRGLASLCTGTSPYAGFGHYLNAVGSPVISTGPAAPLPLYFESLDDLVYLPPTTADTPRNAFISGTAGSIREYKPGICWGALLVCNGTPSPGAPATLSIAVFKKQGGQQKRFTLTGTSGMFMMTPPDETGLKRFLGGCSSVLALSGTNPPRWFRIASSWKQPNADCCVVFENPTALNDFAGSSPTVVGFENLMRVDHYPVTLP